MYARHLQRFYNMLFMNLFVSFILLVVISQQTHCAHINNANTTAPINPCQSIHCGPNANCTIRREVPICQCIAGTSGDPYTGCNRACETGKDCYEGSACIRHKCVDRCPGLCGVDADCYTLNHSPLCSCPAGYTGNPYSICIPTYHSTEKPPIEHACQPSPCGPNSECRTNEQQAVCSCLPGYVGSPPNCTRPCDLSSDCEKDEICLKQKCVDPCSDIPDFCGSQASCYVRNHNVHCSCLSDYTGDPFSQCTPTSESPPPQSSNPCIPSICGENTICREQYGFATCTCQAEYYGNPYERCRLECDVNSDCSSHKVCVENKCQDPCPGTCGANAECKVTSHLPICTCWHRYTGNPYAYCTLILEANITEPTNHCHPYRCGPNANCTIRKEVAVCQCAAGFSGDPYTGCSRACEANKDCYEGSACIRHKCVDPCPGVCGDDAVCNVVNHLPVCSCHPEYTGDSFSVCRHTNSSTQTLPVENSCEPTPCGPNSACRTINGQAVCSCLPEYIGSPPTCRSECVLNSECRKNEACRGQKCIDPCPDLCGVDAVCHVIVSHYPMCSCPRGYTGDPFSICTHTNSSTRTPPIKNPCELSPCGPHSACSLYQGIEPSCSCLPGYIGSPPTCTEPCGFNSECEKHEICLKQKCIDPCSDIPEFCGLHASCYVRNHNVHCSCPSDPNGDPFSKCSPGLPISPATNSTSPCQPNPCGPNSQCREINDTAVCSCLRGYVGSPPSCRTECTVNSDCYSDLACINQRCRDPCPGTCGINAKCRAIEHIPNCNCIDGYTGNPFVHCSPMNTTSNPTTNPPTGACLSSRCGLNTVCKDINGTAVCNCLPGYMGSPEIGCRPECFNNLDCVDHFACLNQKCKDPCPGLCAENATCRVIQHTPSCTCNDGYNGDPFFRCSPTPTSE
ncbi:neurogenic locus notch homolog protein 2-like [Planococcus citri]|uniref:neurogenic locus notch homolog protein 2-like n=1 Tax=Planococcus citri TaxID=170843 RepID=UPI0031F9BF28